MPKAGSYPTRGQGKTIARISGAQADLLEQSRRGELDCSDWDIEELIRGKRRNKAGNFSGRPTKIVPREVHDELAKRVKEDVAHKLRAISSELIEPVIKMIMENPGGISPEQVPGLNLQLKAAQDLMDRFVIGKQEEINVTGTLKHETIIEEVTIRRDEFDEPWELEDGDVVDAEIVDEMDDEFTDWDE